MTDTFSVILTTAGNKDEAQSLADLLVSRRLAACVQIVEIASTYVWKGELQHEGEYLLLIKTSAHRYSDVEAAIVANHSYEVPEIVQLPVEHGLERYLGWVAESTTSA